MAIDPAVEEYTESLPGDRRETVRAVHERAPAEPVAAGRFAI